MPPKPLIDRARRGPFDELWTPAEALNLLLPHISKRNRIWECAPGSGVLVRALRVAGYKVEYRDPADYFTDKPLGSVTVTNPPFSKKAQFLRRANELGYPFAFLLPVSSPGSRECQREMEGTQLIYLPRRIDFTGKGRPWFAVMWVTKGLEIHYGDDDYPQLIFPEEE